MNIRSYGFSGRSGNFRSILRIASIGSNDPNPSQFSCISSQFSSNFSYDGNFSIFLQIAENISRSHTSHTSSPMLGYSYFPPLPDVPELSSMSRIPCSVPRLLSIASCSAPLLDAHSVCSTPILCVPDKMLKSGDYIHFYGKCSWDIETGHPSSTPSAIRPLPIFLCYDPPSARTLLE